ncbi:hypothetical protein PCCS19_00930 [Paenibacillus sp. CCS19]|uniref:copper amine oxidase N-terminal domain-containing protein n=1 Tax=Paenibacillus sp. CCS19 TaxID=3158387 RepID=UPI0025626BC8|nr:copper amine oxidase N-terminal domain-containing protein [Paenibacillus cellulosilyticus]GMK37040.1 hypothetical protein PCCS19_00930 [Paenibacillus cellulosilyticus]
MKKKIAGVLLATTLLASSTAYASTAVPIKIDGAIIASDIKPEVKNNRTMVPLRVISENLGAKVEWSKTEVTLTKSDMKVTLNTNSATALRNGQQVQLDAKPFVINNRIIVPLRFIAETFGCEVNYSNGEVTVESAMLVIKGVTVNAMQNEYHMTMGGVVQQITANALNKAIYNIFETTKGAKVDAPANYSWNVSIDVPGSYYKNAQYDFLGSNGKSVQRYDIYSLIQTAADDTSTDTSDVLLHDVTNNKWYLFSAGARDAVNQLVDQANANGALKVISNTVV